MKAMYIGMSLLTICLNILSMLMHISKLQKRMGQNFQIIVVALNFSDNLCAIYLTIIWVSDMLFKDMYLINEILWKSHPLCFIGLSTVLWFTISNQIIMLYFSFMRLVAIMHPLKIREKQSQETIYQVSLIHMFSFSISLVLTLVFRFIEMQLPTSLCLPFIDPSGLSTLSKVISWLVIISQSVCSVLIAGMHMLLVNKVKSSKESVGKGKTNSIKTIMSQLLLTSTSNIMCWFPTNAIYLSAMYLSTYPIDLVIWATVIVMPINSVINPCVFVVTNLRDIFKR